MSTTTESGRKALLSISIDVAGSTAAKQQIVNFQTKYGQSAEHLDAYLKQICNIELSFYQSMEAIDIFVVKHIGDEIWIVIDVDPDNVIILRQLTNTVLNALRDLMCRNADTRFVITQHDEDPNNDDFDHVGEFEAIPLAIKATVDLIENAVELNNYRFSHIARRLGKSTAEESAALYSRLNLGATSYEGTKVRAAIRTDYVGLDVDRFFRLTGLACPGLILVGDTLSSAINAQSDPVNQAPEARGTWSFELPFESAPTSSYREMWISLRAYEQKFKGLDAPYGGYWLTKKHMLNVNPLLDVFDKSVKLLRKSGLLPPELGPSND